MGQLGYLSALSAFFPPTHLPSQPVCVHWRAVVEFKTSLPGRLPGCESELQRKHADSLKNVMGQLGYLSAGPPQPMPSGYRHRYLVATCVHWRAVVLNEYTIPKILENPAFHAEQVSRGDRRVVRKQ
jgi:hypothetical protein